MLALAPMQDPLPATPQAASAKVYMCVDPVTGKTSFTDRACSTNEPGEEVRVKAANLESGSRYQKGPAKKTWNSERDERKTGLDYNGQRRALYRSDATASAN